VVADYKRAEYKIHELRETSILILKHDYILQGGLAHYKKNN